MSLLCAISLKLDIYFIKYVDIVVTVVISRSDLFRIEVTE